MPTARYVIAYTPPPVSPLARFGAGVLGYDCYDGTDVPTAAVGGLAPAILRLTTVELRRFGFHASFMTPFCLGARPVADLMTELERFAKSNRIVPVGPLAVAAAGTRILLQPVDPPAQLVQLAAACRATFAPLRAPAADDGAGAPEPFRFSLPLVEAVSAAELPSVARALTAAFAPMAGDHLELDAISLLREDDWRLRVVERWRLTGR
jgi:hypothetical protein